MQLNEYQEKAMTTCMPSSANFPYMMLNLIGEVGEFSEKSLKVPMPHELRDILKNMVVIGDACSKMAKNIRKTDKHPLQTIQLKGHINTDLELLLYKEFGDVMWQTAGLANVMGWKLEDVCMQNLLKLSERKKAGTINGSGDGISGDERKAE